MRLSQRAALLLLLGYAVFVGAFALAVDRGLRELEASLTSSAVGLLAREQSAFVEERAIEALQFPDAASQARVAERVASLAQLSTVVAACSVVDRQGRVIAGDPAGALPLAETVFGAGPRVLVEPGRGLLGGGEYVAFVPLSEGGKVLGYLRMVLRSHDVAQLYAQTRWRILAGAVAGVGLVALLAALLQASLRRRAEAVSDALEGRSSVRLEPGDEFARVVEAASGVRRALNHAHHEGAQLRDRFGALAQALEVGVLVTRGTVLGFASPRGLELLGKSDLAAAAVLWAALPEARRGEPWRGPLELPGPRRLHAEASHLGSGESIVLLHDSGPLDSLETDLRLAAQVEALARVYRAFAHELRAPLGALSLHLDLLGELPPGASPADRAAHLEVLRGEVQRLGRLLEDVLTREAPDPARQVPLDLRGLMADLASLLAPQARRQGVDLAVALPEAPIPLVGYPDRLTQAFLNLAVNALEAMPGGGRLELAAEVVAPDMVRVRIHDTGEGMSEERLAEALDGVSSKPSGQGIGLGVARALLGLHAGRLQVRSKPGQGTTVEVELPLGPRAWTGTAQ